MAKLNLKKIYYALGNFSPKRMNKRLDEMISFAGLQMNAKVWFGSALLISLLFGIVAFLFAWIILEILEVYVLAAVFLVVFILTFLILYLILRFRVEDRRKRIEHVLPDALQIIASNIRAGATPLVALRMAARPEFGPLEDEIKYVTAKSLGVESFTDALLEMSKRVKSEVLERTVSLFIVSMRSGGNLAILLENAAEDILESQELKRELIAGTNMYIVFILFTVLVGTPALLSISIEFVSLVSSMQEKMVAQSLTSEIGLKVGVPISADFLFNTSLITLLVTSLFVSLLIGVIHDGKELNGLNYFIFFVICSIAIFLVMRGYILKVLLSAVR
jgi:archaellum biogenesis protein FlaJ (TadC family)